MYPIFKNTLKSRVKKYMGMTVHHTQCGATHFLAKVKYCYQTQEVIGTNNLYKEIREPKYASKKTTPK